PFGKLAESGRDFQLRHIELGDRELRHFEQGNNRSGRFGRLRLHGGVVHGNGSSRFVSARPALTSCRNSPDARDITFDIVHCNRNIAIHKLVLRYPTNQPTARPTPAPAPAHPLSPFYASPHPPSPPPPPTSLPHSSP